MVLTLAVVVLTQLVEGSFDEEEIIFLHIFHHVILHPNALHVVCDVLQAQASQGHHLLPPRHGLTRWTRGGHTRWTWRGYSPWTRSDHT